MIISLDQQLFLFLNSLNSPFWDHVMYALSGRLIWVPLYLAILYLLAVKYGKKMYILIIVIALTITMGNELSVMIKNLTERPRPCHEPALEGMVHIVKGRCGGQYGFVSSHATNSFSVALLSLLLIRIRWYSAAIILWALAVGYSRIYLGVHYPGDVICGSLLGAAAGSGGAGLFMFIDRKYLHRVPFFGSPSKKT